MGRHEILTNEFFVRKECPVCGVPYMVMESFEIYSRERPDHYFYCPNGHRLHYRTSRTEELEAELRDANQCLATCRTALQTSELMREKVEKRLERKRRTT